MHSGVARIDKEAQKKADRLGCAVKNCRGDLVAVLVIPEGEATLPPQVKGLGGIEAPTAWVDEQHIAMTRR
ncbi:MAG: hypothetical protein SGPRY_011658 [Prymnesium sp.]